MPYKKNRGSGLNSRRKDNDLSRSELISKYGFSTFRESDTDQAKLNTKRPSPDFSNDRRYRNTGGSNDPDSDTFKKSDKNKNKSQYNTSIKGEELKRTYRDRGGVLRYPYEALTERTDYLQIDISQYESVKDRTGFSVGRTNRVSPLRGRNPFGLTTKSLVNKGTILLQIPSQVEDGNSVNYGSSELNSIAGAALSGAVNVMQDMAGPLSGGDVPGAFRAGKDAITSALGAADINVDTAAALATKKIATSVVGAFGANVSVNQLLQREEGQILNPNMELLFNGPTLRNFRFAFKMTP